MRWLARAFLSSLMVLVTVAPASATTRILPDQILPEQFVINSNGLIHAESEHRMNELLAALLHDTDIELVAVSSSSTGGQPISTAANDLFELWKIGKRTKANRGLLLVVAEHEQQVRLQVSYELEAIYTDAFISYIEHEQMVPYFQHNRIGEGIEATVELIARRAFERMRNKSYDPAAGGPEDIGGYRTGGAGAQTAVTFGGAAAPAKIGDNLRDSFGAQPTPAAAWERFLELNRRHIKDTELGIYDEPSQALLRQRPNTNAGQDHIVQLYGGRSPAIRQEGDRAAVVFLDDADHLLAPWFFHRTQDGWRLDGTMYPAAVGYNHLNQWHFNRQNHPYAFAFKDFVFDKHGFAFYRPDSRKSPRAFLGASWYAYGYQGLGVLVMQIVSKSAAERAGLEVGDIILKFNGTPITKPNDLYKLIAASQPGETVALEIMRGVLQEPVTVRLDNGSMYTIQPTTRALRPPQPLTLHPTLSER